jgi:hypothetical protein
MSPQDDFKNLSIKIAEKIGLSLKENKYADT